jgi:protein SCO1/2/putative membrane protein
VKRLALAAATLAGGFSVAVGAWLLLRRPAADLPVMGPVPDFVLRDQDGNEFRPADLRGRPWLVQFVFTRCTTVCPVLVSQFSAFHDRLPRAVAYVSISVDPVGDTQAVLAARARELEADAKRWKFLATGTHRERDRILSEFMLTVQDTPEDAANPILHDSRIALVDAAGNLRGYYDANDPEAMARLRADAASMPARGAWGLPAINASLNAASVVLLLTALAFAKSRRFEEHAVIVMGALLASVLFLSGYLTYHSFAGATRYVGPWRSAYLAMLLTHTILAALVPPMVIVTVVKAARRRWDTHKRWAKATVPAWLYVSVTGVAIYWVLFRGGAS